MKLPCQTAGWITELVDALNEGRLIGRGILAPDES